MVHMLCDRSLGASASSYCFFFFFLPQGLWGLSSPTRD